MSTAYEGTVPFRGLPHVVPGRGRPARPMTRPPWPTSHGGYAGSTYPGRNVMRSMTNLSEDVYCR